MGLGLFNIHESFRLKRPFLVLLSCLFIPLVGYAGGFDAHFRNLSSQQGLANDWVRCIYQDDEDFMWFGTADGLSRFDGYHFITFRIKDKDGKEFGNININAIARKNADEMWLCTDIGLFAFNRRTETMTVDQVVGSTAYFCITEDASKKVWLGTNNGLVCYDVAKKRSVQYSSGAKPNSLSNNRVVVSFLDSRGRLWIGTHRGLNLFDPVSETFTRFVDDGKPGSIQGNDILSICEDNAGRLWVGTAREGLNVASPSPAGDMVFHNVGKGYVVGLLVDNQHCLWVACGSGQGLMMLDLDGFSVGRNAVFQHFRNDPTKPESLCDNSVFCLFEDKSRDLWFGSFGGGISYFSKRGKKFHLVKIDGNGTDSANLLGNNMVNTFLEEDDFFWVGTEGGLSRLDKKSKTIKQFTYQDNDARSLSTDPVFQVTKDKRGNLWVGTWAGGINLFDYKTQSFSRFVANGKPGSLSNDNIFAILPDSRGNLWVGTLGGGLNRFDYESRTFSSLTHDWNNKKSLFYDYIDDILETSKGFLYVSTYYSIDKFNYQTNDFEHFVFNRDKNANGGQIITLFEDSKRHIWVGTNVGLYLFDETRGTFHYFSASDTFPNKTIQGIMEDGEKNLWVSTNWGIVKITGGAWAKDDADVRIFTKSDGLPANDFTKRAAYKGKDGMLYFGSSHGYIYFHPDSITLNDQVPNVVLTDFKLLLSSPDNTKKVVFGENINYASGITLSYLQSNFIISFSVLNYLNPGKNSFKYRLDGYDNNWIAVDDQRSATYTNLSPGTYTFQVMASNNDGVWNDVPKSITITITPPWWKTLLFKLAVAVSCIALLILVYLARESIYKRQQKDLESKVRERTLEIMSKNKLLEKVKKEITDQNTELERHRHNLEELVATRTVEYVNAKRKAEESDRLKSAFLANFSHEIRTPLNAIIGFTQLLKHDGVNAGEKNAYLDFINTSSESLLVMINDIMDISLIESNQMTINPKMFSVQSVFLELESYYKLQAANRISIKFINKDDEIIFLKNDRDRFRQILVNLIDNAMKFTEQGHIHFGYTIEGEHVRFSVEDTGIGIEPAELDRIFDHFYKIEKNENKVYRGTGIGLALCKKMVGLMGGTIAVKSEVNAGSTFSFTLPGNSDGNAEVKLEKSRVGVSPLLQKTTVLIAEDEPTNYEVVRNMIKGKVASIIWAHDGQEAIDFVENMPANTPCIVLMDIRMPSVNGYKAMERIKAINLQMPVIAVTAYAQPSEKQKILESGFDDYIPKPIHLEHLLLTLSKYCTNA